MKPTYTTLDIWRAESAKLMEGESLQPDTVTRWCEAGVFPHAFKEGNIWRIPVEDYDPDTFIRPQVGRPVADFEDGYVSVREAAKMAGLSEAAIRDWIYRNKLPAELRKGGYAIALQDLKDYLKKRSE